MTESVGAQRLRALLGESRVAALLDAYDERRGALLPLVSLLRDRGESMTPDTVDALAQLCGVTTAHVRGALTAFAETRRDPDQVCVCDGPTCRLMGAAVVAERLSERLGEGRVALVPCTNACSSAPVLHVRGALYGGLHAEALEALSERLRTADGEPD